MTASNEKHKSPIPTRFRRYECKYLVSEELAAAIRSYASPYLEPDPYAAASPDLSYDITSLYLDSPDLKLFHETEDGLLNRIKLRIRSYDEEPESPVFLEIKRRFDRLVLKGRARIDKNTMAMVRPAEPPGSPFPRETRKTVMRNSSPGWPVGWPNRWSG